MRVAEKNKFSVLYSLEASSTLPALFYAINLIGSTGNDILNLTFGVQGKEKIDLIFDIKALT